MQHLVMRWRRLISEKASRLRIIVEAFLGPSGGLVVVDDLLASVEATVAIVDTEDSFCSCG